MQLPINVLRLWLKIEKAYLPRLAREGKVKEIKHLIAHRKQLKLDIDTQDSTGFTALYLAVIYDHWPCTIALLEAGASPYVRDSKGDSPFHTYIYAERLEMLQFFLWHRPDPEDYKLVLSDRNETAEARIKQWNTRQPGIKQRLDKTVEAIKNYRQAITQANEQLAAISQLPITQQDDAYLKAAAKLNNAAVIQCAAMREILGNTEVKQKWPEDYQAISQYYRQQALTLYQQALACYESINLINHHYFRQCDYVDLIIRLADLHADSHNIPAAKHYYQKAAAQCLKFMQAAGVLQASPLSQNAEQCYKKYQEWLKLKPEPEGIKVLNLAAQWYRNIAAKGTGKAQQLYVEKAHSLYLVLAQLCHRLKMDQEEQGYITMAQELEEQYLQAPCKASSSYRPLVTDVRCRTKTKGQMAEQHPLLDAESDSDGELENPYHYSNSIL